MAWTAPRTWVDTEVVTAALLNAHVRDNMLETAPAKVTTKGDIVVATAANAMTRVGIGSNGASLVADSDASSGVRWSSTSKTAALGTGIGQGGQLAVGAAANSDTLIGLYTYTQYAKSTYTGLTAIDLYVAGTSSNVTGTGTIATAYGVYITPPTIGTANWALYVTGGDVVLGDTASQVFIGDTANANQAVGITIQGGAADEQISLKLTGLAHGMTTITETDTYGMLGMTSSTRGGLYVRGVSKHASAWMGILAQGYVLTADTTKSNAAIGCLHFTGTLTSGTGTASLGANANIAAFTDNGTARFILDSDGDSHQDVGTAWTNFDDRDDVEALNLLSAHVTRPDDPLREGFRDWLAQSREPLEAAKLVTFNDNGHHFVNMSRLTMLLTGAVRQLSDQIQAQAQELTTLRDTVKLLTA